MYAQKFPKHGNLHLYINLWAIFAAGPVETLLDWNTIHKKLPWGIIFLMGGGFCIAEACVVSV